MIMSGMEAAVIDDPITKMMNLMSPMLLCRFDPSFFSSFFFLGVLSRMSSRRISHPLWVLLLLCKDEPLITAVPILPLMTKFTSKEYHTLLYVGVLWQDMLYSTSTIFSWFFLVWMMMMMRRRRMMNEWELMSFMSCDRAFDSQLNCKRQSVVTMVCLPTNTWNISWFAYRLAMHAETETSRAPKAVKL